ncbi:MAG TPA: ISAs1 family transposase [Steroidobacteraceae bacterium]|jgi:predicted transposase YbfD/YdcC
MGKFKKVFRRLDDPRATNASHELVEVLFMALAAVLCGANGAADMAQFGRSKELLLRGILRLEHGIPSHDTFSRIFRLLDPQAFEKAFRRFLVAFAKFNRLDLTGVIAIDGKALRGAYQRGRSATPMQMVNVFAAEARMVLASGKAPGRNEALGALEVLGMLCLKHCIVTGDALHCNRKFATTVLDRDGDYVLALKQNQSKLFTAVARCFARAGTRSSAERLEPRTHDRREWRRATVIRNATLSAAHHFPGIVAVARITSRRRPHGARAAKPFIRYYLLSKYIPAKKLLRIVRSHWAIENQLHWVLDVVFDEDGNRTRKDNAPENLAILRRLAINIIRSHPARMSMRQKIKSAGWDDSFLLGVLSHMR